MIITIDGPVASGKSSTARTLAKKLNLYYINTGLLYRSVAHILLTEKQYTQEQIANPNNEDVAKPEVAKREDEAKPEVAPLTLSAAADRLGEDVARVCDTALLVYEYNQKTGEARTVYKGEDLTPYLQQRSIEHAASVLATQAHVRDCLLGYQRMLAKDHDTIVEGRDCGSIVFPDAEVKFYLTASETVRAQRWMSDPRRNNSQYELEQARAYIRTRDERDKTRKVSPLTIPKNAVIVDNSTTSFEQTIEQMTAHIEQVRAQTHRCK